MVYREGYLKVSCLVMSLFLRITLLQWYKKRPLLYSARMLNHIQFYPCIKLVGQRRRGVSLLPCTLRASDGLGFAVPFHPLFRVRKTETRHRARLNRTEQNKFLIRQYQGLKLLSRCEFSWYVGRTVYRVIQNFAPLHTVISMKAKAK